MIDKTEIGWLVELKNPPTGMATYRCLWRDNETGDYLSGTTTDNIEALRFSRKVDAEGFLTREGFKDQWHATEHMWVPK